MAGEYVDLGLSVKWATMNIGAERIIDHGGYLRLSFFYELIDSSR